MKIDIVIVGGGAVGLSIAYFLKRKRPTLSVSVIERDPSYQVASTPRAAGGIRQLFSIAENIAMSQFGLEFFANFSRIMCVDGEAPPDISFHRNGYIFVVKPADMPALERNYQVQIAHGVRAELLDRRQLKERFPSMFVDDLGGAVFSPDDGWLDPYAVLQGLRAKAKALGVSVLSGDVMQISVAGHVATRVVLRDGRSIGCDAVVNAAGAWAQDICSLVGMKTPINPLKRYEHYWEAHDEVEQLPYFKDAARLAFRREGRGWTGGVPTLTQARGVDFDIDHDYFATVVWPAIAHRFPQFERVKCKNTIAGLYDQNDFDGNPIIGSWRGHLDNFYLAAGFSGHGLMHAPAVGRALSELMLAGTYETIDLSRLSFDRIGSDRPMAETGIV